MTSTEEMTLNLVSQEGPVKKKRVRPADEAQDGGQREDQRSREADDAVGQDAGRRKRPRRGREDEFEGQHDANKPFISSLFRHNPTVPHLEPADIKPTKEEVFTSRGFDYVGLHPYLVKNLKQTCDIEAMTSVQAKAIPTVLAGRDVLVKSQTGSGKTLAYALPILHRLQEVQPPVTRADGIVALVIVPTRELAVQSFEWFEKLCKSFARIVPGILTGGEKKKSEKSRLRKGINVLVCTPGRLLDHMQHTKCLSLGGVRWLVLDEADRMLELGYERDVKAILAAIAEQQQQREQAVVRQTLLLSATLTSGIEQLSEVSLRHPVLVDVAASDDQQEEAMKRLTTPEKLVQTFGVVPAKLRLVTLAAFILWKCRRRKAGQTRKMLIFMATQDMVDFHGELFDRCLNAGDDEDDHVEFLRLHGSMSQADRLRVFNTFRKASSGVLLCTDVASRGLDLPQVDWIVQYNAPVTRADYIHRVGRTARIGTKGSGLLLLLPSEAEFVRELEEESLALAEMTLEVVLTKLLTMGDDVLLRGRAGRPATNMEEAATHLQMRLEEAVDQDEGLRSSAAQAYVSFIRSYASYPKEVREIFCFKELHLGHLAKSFALRDPPSKITGIGKGQWVQSDERKRKKDSNASIKHEETIIKAQKRRVNQKKMVLSEFDSGYNGIALKESAKPAKSTPKGPKGKKRKKPAT